MSALGSLVVKLALEYAQYTGGLDKSEQATLASLKKIQGAADQFSSRVTDGFKNVAGSIVALFGAGALAGHIKAVVDELDRIADAAPAIGMTVQGLAELGYAATMAGSDALSLEGAMGKLNLKVQAAVNGNKEAKQVFTALGVSLTDASGKVRATDDILAELSETFKALPDGPTKSALAVELFGKSGAGMVQFLSQGRDGLQALREEFVALSGGSIEAAAEMAGAFNDQLDKLAVKGNGLTMTFGSELLPLLTAVAEEFTATGDSIWGLGDGMSSVASGAGVLLRTFLETLLLVGADVVFTLAGMGREIGGIAAQAVALANLDWDGIKSIRTEMIEDAERAQKKLEDFQKRIANSANQPSVAGNPDEDSRRKVTREQQADAEKRATAALKETDTAAKSLDDTYKKLMERIKERIHLADQELALGRELTEGEKFAAKGQEELAKLAGKFSARKIADVQSEIAIGKAKIDQTEIEKQIVKELTALAVERARVRTAEANSIAQWFAAQQQEAQQTLQGIRDRLQGLEAEEQAANVAREKNIGLAEAIERVTIARLREKQEWVYEGSERWQELEAEIAARDKLAGMLGKKEVREREEKGWTDMWSSIDQTAHSVFTSVLDGGMSAFKRLGQTLKASVLDVLYQMTVRKWIISIGTSIFGDGFGAAANAAIGGGGGGGSGAVGMAQNGYTAYGLWNGGFGGTAVGQAWSGYTGATLAPGMVGPSATPITMWSQAGNAAGGASGAGAGGLGGIGWGGGIAVAAAALFMNAVGAFRSEKRVGNGVSGTLGKGDIESYELWRTGGTLFSGPRYSMKSPSAEIEKYEEDIKRLREAGQGATEQVYEMEAQVKYLKEVYGEQIAAAKNQSNIIQNAYEAMRTNVGDMADVLGLSSEAVRKFTMSIGTDLVHPDTGGYGLSFNGLTEQEISAKIEEALKTANNTLAQQVIGTWKTITEEVRSTTQLTSGYSNDTGYEQSTFRENVDTVTRQVYIESEYAREGEKAIDTLTRLATSLSTVNAVFKAMGRELLDASLAGGDMASQLVDAFGGLDAFTASTGQFFQLFSTEQERVDALTRSLTESFADLGFELPRSRDELKALANAQDLTTEEGRKLYAQILALGPAFAEIRASAEELASQRFSLNQRLLEAEGKDREALELRRKQEHDALLRVDPELAALVLRIYELEDASKAAAEQAEATARQEEAAAQAKADAQARTDKAFATLQRATDEQRRALEAARGDAVEAANTWRTIVGIAHDAVISLRGEVTRTAAEQAAQGWVFIENAVARVLRGSAAPDSEELSEAIAAARGGLDANLYATQWELDRDRAILAGLLEQLETGSGRQLTTAEKTANALAKQITQLDKQLDYWADQIALARGELDAMLSIADAIKDLRAAILGETGTDPGPGPGVGGGSSGGDGGASWGGSASPQASYSQVRSGGSSGAVWYEPIIDQALIARLDKLAPVYHAFDGTADLVGLADAFKGAGGSIADLSILSGFFPLDWRKAFEAVGVPAFAKGGKHLGGWALVGEQGPELAYMPPARIYTAGDTSRMLAGGQGGSGSSGNVELLLERLIARVDALGGERTADHIRGLNEGLAAVSDPGALRMTVA